MGESLIYSVKVCWFDAFFFFTTNIFIPQIWKLLSTVHVDVAKFILAMMKLSLIYSIRWYGPLSCTIDCRFDLHDNSSPLQLLCIMFMSKTWPWKHTLFLQIWKWFPAQSTLQMSSILLIMNTPAWTLNILIVRRLTSYLFIWTLDIIYTTWIESNFFKKQEYCLLSWHLIAPRHIYPTV